MAVALLKQTIVIHKDSKKHKENKVKYLEETRDDEAVKQMISDYFAQNPNEQQSTLDPETLLYRWRVVEKMMEEGIPLAKVDAMRDLLERGGETLTDSTHLACFVPKIHQREKDAVAHEIKDELGCIIYDGTTRLGEATAVLWRQCPTELFRLQQRLVAVRTTATHMTGDALYRLLGCIVLRDLAKQPEEVICSSRDSCSTNGVAERLLGTLCPAMAKNKCISHILVGTGQHIKLPNLGIFMAWMIQLLTHSHAFRLVFKEVMGEAMPNYSKIRWWSRWDLMEVLSRCFTRIGKLITVLEERGIGESSTVHLREIYDSNERELRHELAMIMDLKCFYLATYRRADAMPPSPARRASAASAATAAAAAAAAAACAPQSVRVCTPVKIRSRPGHSWSRRKRNKREGWCRDRRVAQASSLVAAG